MKRPQPTQLASQEQAGAKLRPDRQRKLDARMAADPEAPWGRRKNGQPKKKPGLTAGLPAMSPDKRREWLLAKDREYQKERRARMTPDEKESFYKRKYHRCKDRPHVKERWQHMPHSQKQAHNARNNRWRKNNPEKAAASVRNAVAKKPDFYKQKSKESARKWRAENPEKARKLNHTPQAKRARKAWKDRKRKLPEYQDYERRRGREYRKSNPEKIAAKDAAKRKALRLATPKWVRKSDIEAIFAERNKIMAETGIRQAVDHIVPLQNKIVCGLNCPINLRVITHAENASKGNRFIESIAVAPTRANGLLKDQ